MSLIEQYDNSLLKAVKNSLIEYFELHTGIKWNDPEKLSFAPSGWINIYQIDPIAKTSNSKVRQPFSKGHYNTYKVQLQINLLDKNISILDDKLLNMTEFITDVIRNQLKNEGVKIIHPLAITPTLLKSVNLASIKKDIKQVSDGNQEDQTDSLWQGTLNFFTEFTE